MEGDAGDLRVRGVVVDGLGDVVHVHGASHAFDGGEAFPDGADDGDTARAVLGDVGLRDFAEELGQHIREAELLRKDAVIVSLGGVDEEGFATVQAVE